MSCYSCTKKYGVFLKEVGCPNCGYSYCSKCLKRSVAVPRHNGNVMKVCLICYDKLSKLQTTGKVIDCDSLSGTLVTNTQSRSPTNKPLTPVDELLTNDLTALPPFGSLLTPIPVQHHIKEPSVINDNLDSVLSQRLNKLKSIETTDDELRMRLSNLSGKPDISLSKKELLLSTDKRSTQEEVRNLLEEFTDEVSIEEQHKQRLAADICDIERRLRALRDTPIDGDSGTTTKQSTTKAKATATSSEGVDESIASIIKKYAIEPTTLPTDNAAEELPWCIICNENADFRCIDCDGDLYCKFCYHDYHNNDEEYRNHVKQKYAPPATSAGTKQQHN